MARNFWEQPSIYRKYFSFSRKTLLVLEKMEEEQADKKNFNKEIEKMIKCSPQYTELVKKLREDGFDIEEFE